MHDLEGFVDSLAAEGLEEAADNFFGRRKALETDMDHFRQQAEKLRDMGRSACTALESLHFVLIQGQGVDLFYERLELDPPDDRDVSHSGRWTLQQEVTLPWALGRKWRYVRLVKKVYQAAQKKIHAYLHGMHYDDPDVPGRKVQSLNLEQLRQRFEKLNAQVENLNQHYRPEDVLLFAKRMDVERAEAEESMGAGGEYTLRGDLAFTPLDWDLLSLPDLPDLPELWKIEKLLVALCRELYDTHPDEAGQVLQTVRSGS